MLGKKIIRLCVVLVLSGVSSLTLSQPYNSNAANNISAHIDNGVLTIPDIYTSISSYALDGRSGFTTVVIPDSVQSIGARAFWRSSVQEVILGDGVTSIGEYAFYETNVHTISFGDALEVIHQAAFLRAKLTSLSFPDSLLTISQSAFNDNPLQTIDFGENITFIGSHAFTGNANFLNNISLPNSLETIGQRAFSNTGITGSLVIPDSVLDIGEYAFAYNDIESLSVSAHTIQDYAFHDNKITSLSLHEGIERIENKAFDSNRLSEVTLPNSLTNLDSQAFARNSIKKVIFGENLIYLSAAFVDQKDLFGLPLSDMDVFISDNAKDIFDSLSYAFGLSDNFTDIEGNYYPNFNLHICQYSDFDDDGELDCLDTDDDNDSVLDADDAFPLDSSEQFDTDGDGIGNNMDIDDDSDGFLDIYDAFPLDISEQHDFDADGIGNNLDKDDDNDGLSDIEESIYGTNPWLSDTDLDGVLDGEDAFPKNPNETLDTDNDGIGNVLDNDDDNDGYYDILDAFPLDESRWVDSDTNSDELASENEDNSGTLPLQIVGVSGSPKGSNGHPLTVSLSYDASDNNNQLTGLGYRVHFDSSYLSYRGAQNIFDTSLFATGQGPYQDTQNFDGDASTDSFIVLGWAAIMADWPNVELPIDTGDILFDVNFEATSEEPLNTVINFSKTDSAVGYNFESTAFDLSLLPASWDFDGNGSADALTDGLMLMRYAFGIKGLAMTENAVAADAALTPEQVVNAMDDAMIIADIDDNGGMSALTDGLILLRYLFGLREEALISDVIDPQALRTDAASIKNYIDTYMPGN